MTKPRKANKMGKRIFSLVLGIYFSLLQFSFAAATRPVYAQNGMVVSASRWASEVGVEILKQGGNAVDAAVATGFALAVTYPQAGNIGGGGFMVARFRNGLTFTLDYREKAPALAFRDMYLDSAGNVLPGASLSGVLAAGVPGSVDGLLKAWETYGSGRISRQQLLRPAIYLALHGFPLTRRYAQLLNAYRDFFAQDDGAAKVFIKRDGTSWQEGDRLIQRDLARTLKLIARYGREGFYEGKVADYIVAEMQAGNGIITHEDLQNYHSKFRPPMEGSYKNYTIISMGPPSSGGVLLVEMLNMLESFPLDSLGWNSSAYVHLLTEVERRAYADRAELLGDSDFWDVPVATLTSKYYARERIRDFDPISATPSSSIYAGLPPPAESQETTHYSVVDKEGNAVSVTTTINTSFGCGVLVEGAGFFLNNEMDDFSLKPGVPNVYGLVGNEANAIQAGQRPLSSMTPTIVLRDGQLFMVIGTPGGSKIITTVLQVILNVVEFDMDIQEAVAAPRVHSQWLPDIIFAEPWALSVDVQRNLEQKGHVLQIYPGDAIGRANGILILEDGLYGGADPRGENEAVGY